MLQRAICRVSAWLKSRIFPGAWFAWRNIQGTLRIDGSEIPADAGNTWVGLMGFGNLRKCPPVELTYQVGEQSYRAFVELKPGAFYVVWGDRLVVEETASGETIPLVPTG